MTLQEKFPGIEFVSMLEGMIEFGWKFNYEKDKLLNIRCCNDLVEISDLNGLNYMICRNCGKYLQNITGLHILGNAVVGYVDLRDVDLKKAGYKTWYCLNKGE